MPSSGSHSACTWSPRSREATSISASLASRSLEMASRNGRHSGFSSLRIVMIVPILVPCVWALLSLLAPVLISDQPVHASKRQDRSREGKQVLGVRCTQVDDHELTHDRQEGDENDRTNLHNAPASLGHHQQGSLEFKCNDNGEYHSEQSLEHGIVCRIKPARENAGDHGHDQVPKCKRDNDHNQPSEDENHRLLEPLIERQEPPSRAGSRKLFLHRHRRLLASRHAYASRLTVSFCRGIGRYSTPPPCARTGCG